MPVTIKSANLKYRNSQGQYVGVNSVSDQETSAQLAAIAAAGTEKVAAVNSAGAAQINAVQNKGDQVLNSIPDDFSEWTNEVESVKSAINDLDSVKDCFVEDHGESEHVTLTNEENTLSFYNANEEWGFNKTYSDGVITFTAAGTSELSPYAVHNKAFGNKKWIVGFKYKLTKVDPNLPSPEKIRIHLGTAGIYDSAVVWGQWVNFAETASVDLTRIRFAVANFPSAVSENSFYVEIKDMYVYDATDASAEMCDYIIAQQNTSYQDGTVTYGETSQTTYTTDTSLSESGKVADSKAVGDAIAEVSGNVATVEGSVETLEEDIDTMEESIGLLTDEISATLTDLNEQSHIFDDGYGTWDFVSVSDGVYSYEPNRYADANVYAVNRCALGSGKWLVSFKFRLVKLDPQMSDPEYPRVILGASEGYNFTDWQYDTWIEFTKITEIDLTRVYFTVVGFHSAPSSTQVKLEVKEFYIYNLANVDGDLYSLIIDTQNEDYKSGTVTYKKTRISDEITGSFGRINVKNYGVKGDGETDDTDAINALFVSQTGSFYFPAGEYMISGTIAMPHRSEMFGDGDDTIINMYSCDHLQRYLFRDSDDYSYPYIVANDDTKIHDIKLIGNNNLQTERHHGIGGFDATNVSVYNVTVYNINYNPNRQPNDPLPVVSAYGIGFVRCNHVNIERCYVEQCGYECIGFADLCTNCVARDCITKNGWRTCIQVHRGVKNVIIDNCYMIQGQGKYDACFTLHGLDGINLVENLRVENCTLIMLTDSVGQQEDYCAPLQFMSYCEGLWCVNNKVTGGKRALYASASVTGLKVIGNQLDCNENSDYGIKIESANAIVIGNTVKNDAESGNRIPSSAVVVGNIGIS